MNTSFKTGLLVASIGLAMSAGNANAAVANHQFISNAVNYCQNFVPGAGSQIRNRVIGVENVGGTTPVACNFHAMFNGATTSLPPRQLDVWFSNNGTAPITVTCTLLTGYQGEGGTTQYAVSKTTAPIAPGGTSQQRALWTPADNPVAGSTNLGNYLIGINCSLPTGAVMNDTYLDWSQDNGI